MTKKELINKMWLLDDDDEVEVIDGNNNRIRIGEINKVGGNGILLLEEVK